MAERPVRILVVDDEPLLRRLLLTALEARGHAVDVCSDGEEALEKFEKGRYDLVVTDFRMPRMTGVELIQNLLRRPTRVPVVLTSSDTLEEMKIPSPLEGVEFLQKPFGLSELFSAVQRALHPKSPE